MRLLLCLYYDEDLFPLKIFLSQRVTYLSLCSDDPMFCKCTCDVEFFEKIFLYRVKVSIEK